MYARWKLAPGGPVRVEAESLRHRWDVERNPAGIEVAAIFLWASTGATLRKGSPLMKKKTSIAGAALALALIAAACGGSEETAAPSAPAPAPAPTDMVEAERHVLRWGAFAGDAGRLDPHFAAAGSDRMVVDMIFNGLVRFKPGNIGADFEPDIAVAVPEPTLNASGQQVWTFELRQGVMCHAGPATPSYELTSEDVVYSLKRAANPETSAYAADYTNFVDVKALDPYKVEITLNVPRSPLLFLPAVADYSGGFIVCKQAAEATGADLGQHPVGTGPFAFTDYVPGDSVMLTAHDDYFRGVPKLAGVHVLYLPDASSRELALQAGEVDAIYGIHERLWVDRLEALPGVRAHWIGMLGNQWLHFNVEQPPFDDLRVRQAVAHAVSRDEHVALSGQGLAEPSYGFIVGGLLPGGISQEEAAAAGVEFARDLDKAKALLTEAGYPNGFSFKVTTSEMPLYRDNYIVLQAALTQIGVTMEIDVVEHSVMHAIIREGSNGIIFYSAWRPNTDVFLTRFAHSDAIVVGGARPDTNFSFYGGIDGLIEEARDEPNAQRQADLWRQANIKLIEDMAIYPLYVGNQAYAHVDGLDYGHDTVAVLATYPQFTELTSLTR